VREQGRSSYGKLVDDKLREKGSERWSRDGKDAYAEIWIMLILILIYY
jgi:hypothetical protein